MGPPMDETRRMEMLSILGDIEHHHEYFKTRGIDASDPGDRECHDIICRIERQLLAQPIQNKSIDA